MRNWPVKTKNIKHCHQNCPGIFLYAVIVGSASSLLHTMDQTAATQKRQMADVNYYMSFHKVASTSKSNIKEKRVEGISEVGGGGGLCLETASSCITPAFQSHIELCAFALVN
jgi:hypothetical protein